MTCAHCGSPRTRVKETRKSRVEVVRARVCLNCGRKFTTTERVAAEYIRVRKRDGSIEPFVREKLSRSIARSDPNGDLSLSDIKGHVDRVTELLQPESPDVPVRSTRISELVVDQLYSDTISNVVCVRYAAGFLGRASDRKLFRNLDGLLVWVRETFGDSSFSKPGRAPAIVVKRDGRREAFDPEKLARSVMFAAKGAGDRYELQALADRVVFVTQQELKKQVLVTSGQIAHEALKELLERNQLAYLRYASTVKRYGSVHDFWLDGYPLVNEQDAG